MPYRPAGGGGLGGPIELSASQRPLTVIWPLQVPPDRWDVDVGWYEHNQLNKRFGSFVDGAKMFDHAFFGISSPEVCEEWGGSKGGPFQILRQAPTHGTSMHASTTPHATPQSMQAIVMDAQQRLLLEGCWEVLADSITGPTLETEAAAKVGVAVGISYNEYYLNSVHRGMTAFTATSGTLSVVCGRISYTFGLKGPSISIDTACSSSLVGAHLASTSFLPEGSRRALVCGINLTIRAETTAVLSKASMLTADGRCKTLDAAADGYMRGEACVVHLLENPEGYSGPGVPEAVIRGSAVNQDGRSSSLTAPNGPSQQAVIRRALASDGESDPWDISALEMHGTGARWGFCR